MARIVPAWPGIRIPGTGSEPRLWLDPLPGPDPVRVTLAIP